MTDIDGQEDIKLLTSSLTMTFWKVCTCDTPIIAMHLWFQLVKKICYERGLASVEGFIFTINMLDQVVFYFEGPSPGSDLLTKLVITTCPHPTDYEYNLSQELKLLLLQKGAKEILVWVRIP